MSTGRVVGLARSDGHRFSKQPCEALELVAGLGVAGDAHAGSTVQHLSRVRKDPNQPNLRQVHLIHAELFDELAETGFALSCGDLGENVLTRGLNLLDLPTGTLLHIGSAVIRVTGLRNPCAQIEAFRPGLLSHMVRKRSDGSLERRCGIMGIVEVEGALRVGDLIGVELPEGVRRPLEPV
ncbi:MOSC domain protein [Tsuneonella dongtanensis]|uniref:MOSC domain protein n=1 Tax=Tsuneonella dongtanensis TaxID=692370 RepID=A0A1B2AFX3_9SPHN|nr:MOSC domain-containing protein [Tsuneonella dongtanensis]ANY21052.1 MOSC domain protein [Tsuneonella dongtanensis]